MIMIICMSIALHSKLINILSTFVHKNNSKEHRFQKLLKTFLLANKVFLNLFCLRSEIEVNFVSNPPGVLFVFAGVRQVGMLVMRNINYPTLFSLRWTRLLLPIRLQV